MGKTVLNDFDKTDALGDLQKIEACHRLKSYDNSWSNKVIVKFSKCKDIVRVMNKKIPWKMLIEMAQVSPKQFIIYKS